MSVNEIPSQTPPRKDPLAPLLAASAAGSEQAFAELYDRTSQRVYTHMVQILRCPEHAADVTQETYQQVWRLASHFDPDRGSVMAWISVIARHRAIDRIRARARLSELEARFLQHADSPPAPDAYDDVISRLDAVRVREAMNCLTSIQYEALTLRYFDSCSLNEMAAELRLPLGTVKTRVRDALIRLRRHVHASDFGDTDEQAALA